MKLSYTAPPIMVAIQTRLQLGLGCASMTKPEVASKLCCQQLVVTSLVCMACRLQCLSQQCRCDTTAMTGQTEYHITRVHPLPGEASY